MRRTFAKQPDGTIVETEYGELARHRSEGFVWVDLVDPTPTEVMGFGQRLEIEPIALEDALTDREAAKVDDYGDYMVIVLHGIDYGDDGITNHEIDMYLGTDFLVTVRKAESPGLEWVMESAQTMANFAEGGPDRMAARIAEATVRRFLPVIDELEAHIDALEDAAIAGHSWVVGATQRLRHDALALRRQLGPQREAILAWSKDGSPLVSERARRRLSDVYSHLHLLVESIDTSRSLLAAVLETYRSSVAEKLNEVMKVLTVFSAILMPLSLMAGLYGMNFVNMPELAWRWGYFALLGLMAVTAIGLWLYFASRGFIGRPKLGAIPGTIGRGLGKGLGAVADLGTAPIRLVLEGLRTEADEQADH